MTHTSFREKVLLLTEIEQANKKMKELLGKIEVALNEQGFPLRKDYPLDGYQLFPDAEPPDPERLK
jgi:NADH:ubiquinone oxidoreductase subunit C